MNTFWIYFIWTILLLFQGIQAQIRILITAEANSDGKGKKPIALRCRVTDTTDIHIKCRDLWWTKEINQVGHNEVIIGKGKQKSFTTGYQTELRVHQPNKQTQQLYKCHAQCELQTFTATCQLQHIKRGSMIECSSHFMNSYRKLKQMSESNEIQEMKTTMAIGVPLFGIMLLILLIIASQKIWKKFNKSKVPDTEPVEIIEDQESVLPEKESKPTEFKHHERPSIMLNGELILDGNTPFAKVTYKSNNKPVISYVKDTDALQNWDPGVSCFTLAESEDSTVSEENSDAEKLLVPDNDDYTRNRSASCPLVPTEQVKQLKYTT